MKKIFILLVGVISITFAESIRAAHLEKLNRAIDKEEDIHIVSVDYEKGELKALKIDAYCVNGDLQLSTTYDLAFNDNGLTISLEDFATGMDSKALKMKDEPSRQECYPYQIENSKKNGVLESRITRDSETSAENPLAAALISCKTMDDDELQIMQTYFFDDKYYVQSVKEGLQANIQAILDDEDLAASFVFAEAYEDQAPGNYLYELFRSRMRVYLYGHGVSKAFACVKKDK